ncbi:MAG: transporter substrate-binding domain-containing protein [Pseudomonadota bacterium]
MLRTMIAAAAACVMACSSFAAELNLMTEEYPPYNFKQGDEIVGMGAEQVFELMDRAGLAYDVELTRWSRAIGLARRNPDTCVFSTFRTADREAAFVWIGPLTEDRSLLIKTEESDIALDTLEDALEYSVGTQTGEFTVGILEAAGFAQVEQAPSMADALKKLLAGRNDLMAVPELYFKALREDGVPVVSALALPALEVALACNPQTEDSMVAALRAAMTSMINDGTQSAIVARYQ